MTTAPRAYDRVVADGYAGQYVHARADPYVISDFHVGVVLKTFQSALRAHGVSRGDYRNVGSDHYVVADFDFPVVDERKIKITVKVIADENVLAAPVREKRLRHDRLFPDRAEAFPNVFIFALIAVRQSVVGFHRVKILKLFGNDFFVVGVVNLPRKHFFLVCHSLKSSLSTFLL